MNENRTYKEYKNKMKISPVIQQGDSTNAVVYSFDLETSKFSYELKKNGEAFSLATASDVNFVLRFGGSNPEEYPTAVLIGDIEDRLNGKVSFVMPKRYLGFDGRVLGEVNIQFTNGQSLTAGHFSFVMKPSYIDEGVEIAQQVYVERFEDLEGLLKETSEAIKNNDIVTKDDLTKIQSGFLGEFNSESELKAKYPNGEKGYAVVFEDSVGYTYTYKDNNWVKGNIWNGMAIADDSLTFSKFKAKNKLYSVLPSNPDLWHMFKVDTTVGNNYMYNNTGKTIQNSDDYFLASVTGYGAYTTLLPVNKQSMIYLRGTNNYRISMIEYNDNKKIVSATQWANSIDKLLEATTAYIVFSVKRYDNQIMNFSELVDIDCGAYSNELNELTTDIDKAEEYQITNWVQGIITDATTDIPTVAFSNARQSCLFKVNPSTEYIFEAKLVNNCRYSLAFLDKEKNILIDANWITTKNKVSIRTSPDMHYIKLMGSVNGDVSNFKDAQRLPMNFTLLRKDGTEVKESPSIITNGWHSNNDLWLPNSLEKDKDGYVYTVPVKNRCVTRVPIKKDTIYLINNNSDYHYNFNYVQTDANGKWLHETYWMIGGTRLKNDVDGWLYIVLQKWDYEQNKEIDFPVSDAYSFDITIEETTMYNELLDYTTPKKLIAHRGASEEAPENTLAAFKLCGENNVWGCEMDVQYTKDNVAIIMHDDTVDRMTDGTGKVSEFTLEEIKKLKINSGNNYHLYPDEKVPTLEEAIKTCKRFGTMPVLDIGQFVNQPSKMLQFLEDLKKLGIEKSVIVICQTTWLASFFRHFNKITPIVAAFNGLIGDDLEARRLFRFTDAYCGGWYLTSTNDQIKNLIKKGHELQLLFYILENDKNKIDVFFDLGIDFISSDKINIT